MTVVRMTVVLVILAAGVMTAAVLAVTNAPKAEISRAGAGDKKMEKATFAAGCFWGVEAAFRKVNGVKKTTVGYTGGTVDKPTYKQVCRGDTGHAEAVEVIYDPQKVAFDDLLAVFWSCHDPTQRNRQGPDIGTQYRSVIFYHTPEQKKAALASKAALEKSGKYKKPVVTQIVAAKEFFRAEEYHQQYLEKRGLATCHF
jgi:peptide-methionine (S)-S-oxide reductase